MRYEIAKTKRQTKEIERKWLLLFIQIHNPLFQFSNYELMNSLSFSNSKVRRE